MTNKLSIIIPAFSGLQQTRRCLQSLAESDYRDFEIILVDHGVSDELSRLANDEFPRVTCLRGSTDLWWSGATNLGIRHALEAGSQWLMLLNHDCYVQPETVGTLLKNAENNENSVIAPVQHMLREGHDIIGITSCFLLGFPTIVPPAAWYRLRYPTGLVPTPLIGGGRGVIVSATTLQHVGLLDEEHMPHYYADHDFYFRCRKAGLQLFICQDTRVNIDDSMTSSADPGSNPGLAGFADALKNRGSHRNVRDLRVLFSRYYPIPGLPGVGVALNTVRFFFVSLAKMFSGFMKGGKKGI
ncbi:MAG: glycosyltransferase family 2 protein [Gammaproteobacteria bacterium]